MKPKIIITYGLPASGKSTWSKKMVEDNPDSYVRVNKDDLRAMMFNGEFTEKRERFIEEVQEQIIFQVIDMHKNVIVDNTHIAKKWIKYMKGLATEINAGFAIKRFDTPVEVCIERDSKRKGQQHVGKDVIMKMYNEMK